MKILVFQHVPHEHPGYISEYADEREIRLDIVKLWKPYSIPEIKSYEALVIMGGPMGAYENYPSKDDEIKTIRSAVGNMPIIGFCLGSQLIASALGAKIYPNIKNGKKLKEIGFFKVNLTSHGKRDKIFQGLADPIEALEWHGDVFEMPEGARLLASTSLCANQAFSYKDTYGFLFHFEFTPQMIEKQIQIDNRWIHEDNELDEMVLIEEAKRNAHQMKQQCYKLLDNFLEK